MHPIRFFNNKMVALATVGFVLLQVNLYAANNKQKDTKDDSRLFGYDIPLDTSGAPKGVVRRRMEAKTSDRFPKYKEAQVRRQDRKRILGEVFDTSVLMSPVTRIIRPVDTIGVSPTYITQIIFPPNMKITSASSSFSCPTFEFSDNLLQFRPDARTFYTGNIPITLTDGSKNYAMNIFVDRYYQENCIVNEDAGDAYICRKKVKGYGASKSDIGDSFKYTYNNLSAYYVYSNPEPLGDLDALSMYEQVNGKALEIKKDKGSVSFQYDGLSYKIERDDRCEAGCIHYRGKKYIITNGSQI